ncbi:tetratricopeptide repeat protein [Chelativorans sp. AA-79]|uniref:tetratricopeptide repeat protein n=1 Tax=Chelativorans sp. AA-79 TaxID=3028735 RepID=UPI0023F74D7A|nr:tetratricopeptide repeat protein [Chelativorans sp. AA-79]WEX09916.1 tetratricopeptide repeat protein [Chelativorans sp. AA-79]
MRRFLVSGCLVLALLMPSVSAAETAAASSSPTEQHRLDELFAQLKQESNEAAARRIASRIRDEWERAGGATADLLIAWAHKAAAEKKFNVALDLLDQAVTLYPQYVESWNSRALVFLMMNDVDRAMSDLAQVLSIEPRHFGAMSGLAGILRVTGRTDEALEVYRRMLDVYPMQRNAQRAVLDLADEKADERL